MPKEVLVMLDVYMILLLGGMFALFTGFMIWCDRVARDAGGEGS